MSAAPEHLDEVHPALPESVLVVEDDEDVATVVTRMLERRGCSVTCVEGLHEAREAIRATAPSAVLVDLRLPTGSGLELVADARSAGSAVPVVVMTGFASREVEDVAYGLGAAGVLTKPFDEEALLAALSSRGGGNGDGPRTRSGREPEEPGARRTDAAELELALARATAAERGAQVAAALARRAEEDAIVLLSRVIGSHGPETDEHNERVGTYAAALARAVGWDGDLARELSLAARLHDIGTHEVPEAVLSKPGPLTDDELALVRAHCRAGFEALHGAASTILHLASQVALTHHERWDGEGYPRGLEGERIPLAGRIVAIADAFDALTSDRPYRRRHAFDDACRLLRAEAGRQFDPCLVEVFLSLPAVRVTYERRGD